MKVNTRDDLSGVWDGQFLSGSDVGFHESVKIHVTANLIGDIEIGENTRIDGNVTITGNVKIGRNCHIATGASLFGAAGIEIADNCGISVGVAIFTGTDNPDIGVLALHSGNELERGAKEGKVTLEEFVTIGANSVIYPGMTLGRACMVGALSFVNTNLEPGWIYAGSPARGIRPRPPLRYDTEQRPPARICPLCEGVIEQGAWTLSVDPRENKGRLFAHYKCPSPIDLDQVGQTA